MAEAVTERGPADGPKQQTNEKSDRDVDEFLRQAVKRFNRAESKESANRMMAVDDLKFKQGDQWPDWAKANRTIEKRPCLTINKMKTFVHQITNDQRQNRPAINVSPVGDKSDPETAKMLKGLIRQIERQSNADVAYDTGFDSAVSGGWGYWRILTDYEDDDTFDQVIKIARIRNPFRVYLDPDHEEPDGSDAKWGFISDLITKQEFEDQWPDADTMAWTEGGVGDEYKSWSTSTHVRIAEYFYQDIEERNLVALTNGHVGWEDELDESLMRAIERNPDLIKDERVVQVKKWKWCKITCWEILEENEWAGKWIPIVKVIGDETDVEGKVTFAGMIRDAKDAQRMYNFWVTSETELIALAPKAPWVMEEGQIERHEKRWAEANVKSLPYLLYKGTNINGKPAPPPQRQQFAGPPAGVVQAKISAAQDMQATTGIRFDATLQERTYDESGKALRELKRTGDLGNFHYVDNLSRSLRHTGRILIDLIPKIYDTPRVLTILREDGSEERVKIDPTLGKPHSQQQLADGRVERLYNPKLGDYEVAVTVGPSYATKRAEAADSMLAFMKAVPSAAPVIGDLIAKNMDWPGADDIATRMQVLLPPQVQALLGKQLDQFPAEAKGLITNLMQQLQQLQQQHQQALALLGDKEKDRAIDLDKINKDFEAKILKITMDFEAKIAALQSKGGGEKDDTPLQLHKIERDFEAKVLNIAAQMEAKLLDIDAKKEQVEAKKEETNVKKEQSELHKGLIQVMEKMKPDDSEVKELKNQVKELTKKLSSPAQIEFIRDKKTNRITGAKRVH